MKPLLVHSDAESELWRAVEYYSAIRKELGRDLVEEIQAAFTEIREAPQAWSARYLGTRVKFIKRFPYGVFYLETDDMLWVVAFAHVKRRPLYWRRRIKKLK